MSEQVKQEQQEKTVEQQVILGDSNPATNENNIDSTGEIKSRIEEDIKEVSEKAAEKDWAAEFKSVEDKYLRLYAEFDNYKRRTAAERVEFFKYANQEMLVAMLPVLDDIERAMRSMQTLTDINALKEGTELVNTKLKNILTQKGLKPMDCMGKDFDPEFHEAITKIPAPSEELKGKVVDVVENGYFLNDKVVRFAKVVVGE
ncbi:MAG: nucleotide exchange factor GrpE [Bacteroidia bacterium]